MNKRSCPNCKYRSVIDDGYCGHCRQCTLPPLPKKRDVKICCVKCGWMFIVLEVPDLPAYKDCGWFCPHCGANANTAPIPKGKIGSLRIRR